jgi:Skp family chaperone for outer membrane proteins
MSHPALHSPARLLARALLAFAFLAVLPAGAQDSMQQLRQQLAADKKQMVTANMDLTAQEAAAFWPVYDQYQKELQAINERLATMVSAYAKEYNAGSLTDERAMSLMKEAMAADDSEGRARQGLAARLTPILPGRKLVRYLQIESKVRALINYELAAEVPLVR